MFSPRRGLQADANHLLSPSAAALRARIFFAARLPVVLPDEPLDQQNAYQHFRSTRRARFTAP